MQIKLVKSSFNNEAETKRQLIDFIRTSEILSMNKYCLKFEAAFAKKQQRKYAVYVSSGSMANLLLIQSLLNLGRLKKGDCVGFSSLTWATNVMPIIQLGLVPMPLDCELTSLNVSPKILKARIQNLSALFITNVLGFCDRLDEIKKLCEKNNVLLLEDNCESLGSRLNGVLLGNFGIASTFSFFVGHHLSTIEGGMICTDDEELWQMLVMARAHGWDRNLPEEVQKQIREKNNLDDFYSKYTFYDLAYNARPTEIQGFLGNTQLPFWDQIVEKRQNNFTAFQKEARANDDFITMDFSHMETISNFDMPIVCKTAELAQKYKKKFLANQIEIRPIIAGDMTQQPFYNKYMPSSAPLPNSKLVHDNGFYFPNNAELTKEEIKFLCGLLKK